jgi:hypothetical protein
MEQDVSVLLDKLDELTRDRNAARARATKAINERDAAVRDREHIAEAAKQLVARVHFDDGRCKACSKGIYWIKHRAGPVTAYDADGVMHVQRCAGSRQFSRGPKQQQMLYEGTT